MMKPIAIFLVCFLMNVEAFASDYRMVVFGYGQSEAATQSHSFATFYRVTPQGPADVLTISWLPCEVTIAPLRAQRGCNFTLEQTLRIRGSRSVGYWAPVEIPEGLYSAVVQRLNRVLRPGLTDYKMIDDKTPRARRMRRFPLGGRAGGWANCVHAVSDLSGQDLPNGGLKDRMWGERMSVRILRLMAQRWGIRLPYPLVMYRGVASRLRVEQVLQ